MAEQTCAHIALAEASAFVREDRNAQSVCMECVKMHPKGDWVHLRLCKACGQVLCCDSSPNQHMSKHQAKIQHGVSQSIEVGESWMYCFIDHLTVDQPQYLTAVVNGETEPKHHPYATTPEHHRSTPRIHG